MISHDGITASIISKGAPLLETTIDPNNPMLAFCEAKLGEEFRVNVKGKMPSHHDVMIQCYMDGIWVGGSCYRRKKHKDYSATFRGVKLPNDTSKLQPFKFSGIQLTDDDKVAPINKKEIERLGTIKVELSKCLTRTRCLKNSEIKKSEEKESEPLELASKRVFAEGSKIIKKSHLVGLGDPVTVPAEEVYKYEIEYTSLSEEPYRRFEWQYGSKSLCPVSSTYKEEMSAPQAESQITPLTSVACDSSTDKTAHPIPKPHEEPKIQKALNNVEVPKKLLCDPPENQVAHKTRCGECFENPIIIDGDESGAAIPSTRGESPEKPNILNMKSQDTKTSTKRLKDEEDSDMKPSASSFKAIKLTAGTDEEDKKPTAASTKALETTTYKDLGDKKPFSGPFKPVKAEST